MLCYNIPSNVMDSDLPDSIKLFMGRLCSSLYSGLYIGDFSEFCEPCKVSIQTIKNHVKTLLKEGYLKEEIEGFSVQTSVYVKREVKEPKVKPKKVHSNIKVNYTETYKVWKDTLNRFSSKHKLVFDIKKTEIEFETFWNYWESKNWKRGNKLIDIRATMNTWVARSYNKLIDYSKKNIDKPEKTDYNKLSNKELFVELNKMFPDMNIPIAFNSAQKGVKIGSYQANPALDNNHIVEICRNYNIRKLLRKK